MNSTNSEVLRYSLFVLFSLFLYAKRSFYAAVNGLFGKLLNLASDEVISELVRAKILLYGLGCFQLG